MYPLAHLRSPRDSYNKIAPKPKRTHAAPTGNHMRSLYIDSTLNNYFQPLLSKYKIHRAHRSSKCCTGCKASGTARPANKSSCRAGGCRAGCMPADSGVRPSGVLQPVQKVLVLVIAGLHVHSGAGFVLGADVVTQAGTCQRGIIMPAGGPVSGAMPSRTFIASA